MALRSSQGSSNDAALSHSSEIYSINETITEMSEHLQQVENGIDEIHTKIQSLDDDVTELKNSVIDRARSVSAEISNLKYQLGT